MITDDSIREQGYLYFLTEAPELLQTIEQELFSLSEGHSVAKVHNLMRATHTIKGGAANVGLEVINKIAHSLEDIFKSLYNPDINLDTELLTLLFQAYECLQLPLAAELNGGKVDTDEILQRAAIVFAQLQEKLGDAFGAEVHIPTSEELGFDIVLSIFETGVTQRLQSIAEVLKAPENTPDLGDFLRQNAEVFLGLAESLNLPGFGEIAQTIIAALAANPTYALKITEIAFADLEKAREAVFAGDRTRGGEPSSALQKFLLPVTDDIEQLIVEQKYNRGNSLRNEIEELYNFLIEVGNTKNEPVNPSTAKFYLKVIRYILGWFNHELEIPESKLSLTLIVPKFKTENPVNYIENWLSEFLIFLQEEADSYSLSLYRQGVILTILLAIATFQDFRENTDSNIPVIEILQDRISELAKEYKNYPPVTSLERNWLSSPKLEKLLEVKEILSPEPVVTESNLEAIWGEEITPTQSHEIEGISINEVDYSLLAESVTIDDENTESSNIQVVTSEAIINNKGEDKPVNNVNKSRQRSFVRVDVEGLQKLNYLAGELLIYQKRRNLKDEHLKEIIEQLLKQLSLHQTTLNELRDLPLQIQKNHLQRKQNNEFINFDSLEWDEYTEFHMTLHEALEETLQLQETTESLDLLLRQSTQIHEKKQRLALGIIDNLVEARMSPLGNILNRFPQMMQNLGNMYGKQIELKLTGSPVLVDKAIAEKLYDPLLHLLRNAFDHGIEAPEVRRERNKPERGLIEVCAYHQGSQTIIEVRDDGQGLNLEKIRKKGVELGYIADDEQSRGYFSHSTQQEILDLLFVPGFSTAGKVSEISGRGMGLDIVRSQLEALNGSITIQSVPNQGTTFVLKIPFSMTTDKLMIVQAGDGIYALLLDSIEKILLPTADQIKEFEGKKVLHWSTGKEERMVSVRKLSELMHYNGSLVSGANLNHQNVVEDTKEKTLPVLLLRRNQELLGLIVDQIVGEQELVIRPLGNTIIPPKYIYGCSSLASGNLILVIDGTLLLESHDVQVLDANLTTVYSTKKKIPMSGVNTQATPLLAPANVPTLSNASKVVLVVDDAISLRQTLSLTLQKAGYQVLQAQHGVEALEQLQRHPEIQVVISDLEMPRMNGFELLSNIRQHSTMMKKPVVILTSRSAEKHRQLAQALGATAYLTKPYLEHEFLSTVEGLTSGVVTDLTQLYVKAS
jgi:chemotaxis family two-component system sensor histidine kinase/response regulator PixL